MFILVVVCSGPQTVYTVPTQGRPLVHTPQCSKGISTGGPSKQVVGGSKKIDDKDLLLLHVAHKKLVL